MAKNSSFADLEIKVRSDVSGVDFTKVLRDVDELKAKLKSVAGINIDNSALRASIAENLAEIELLRKGKNLTVARMAPRVPKAEDGKPSAEGVSQIAAELTNDLKNREVAIRKVNDATRLSTQHQSALNSTMKLGIDTGTQLSVVEREMAIIRLRQQGVYADLARKMVDTDIAAKKLNETLRARASVEDGIAQLRKRNAILSQSILTNQSYQVTLERIAAAEMKEKSVKADRIQQLQREQAAERAMIAVIKDRDAVEAARSANIGASQARISNLERENAIMQAGMALGRSSADIHNQIAAMKLREGMVTDDLIAKEQKLIATRQQLQAEMRIKDSRQAVAGNAQENLSFLKEKNRILKENFIAIENNTAATGQLLAMEQQLAALDLMKQGQSPEDAHAQVQLLANNKQLRNDMETLTNAKKVDAGESDAAAKKEIENMQAANALRGEALAQSKIQLSTSAKRKVQEQLFFDLEKQKLIQGGTGEQIADGKAKEIAKTKVLNDELRKELFARKENSSAMNVFVKGIKTVLRSLSRLIAMTVVFGAAYGAINFFKRTMSAGYEYLAMLEQVRLGTAATITATTDLIDTATGSRLNATQAVVHSIVIADEAIRQFKEDAITIGLDLQALIDLFPVVAGSASAVGVPLRDQVVMTEQLVLLGQKLGLTQSQLKRTVDNVFRGQNVQRSELGAILQLTSEMVQEWKRGGEFVEQMRKRLAGVNAVFELNIGTARGLTLSIKAIARELLGNLGGRAFEQLKLSFMRVREEVLQFFKDTERTDKIGENLAKVTKSIADSVISIGSHLPGIIESLANLGDNRIVRVLTLIYKVQRWVDGRIRGNLEMLGFGRGVDSLLNLLQGPPPKPSKTDGGLDVDELRRRAIIHVDKFKKNKTFVGADKLQAKAVQAVGRLRAYDPAAADRLNTLLYKEGEKRVKIIGRMEEEAEERRLSTAAERRIREANKQILDLLIEYSFALEDLEFSTSALARRFKLDLKKRNLEDSKRDRELDLQQAELEEDPRRIKAMRRAVDNEDVRIRAHELTVLKEEIREKRKDRNQTVKELAFLSDAAVKAEAEYVKVVEEYNKSAGDDMPRSERLGKHDEVLDAQRKLDELRNKEVELRMKLAQGNAELIQMRQDKRYAPGDIARLQRGQDLDRLDDDKKEREKAENAIDASNRTLIRAQNKLIKAINDRVISEAELALSNFEFQSRQRELQRDLEQQMRLAMNEIAQGRADLDIRRASFFGVESDVASAQFRGDQVGIDALKLNLLDLSNRNQTINDEISAAFISINKNKELIAKSYEHEEWILNRIVKTEAQRDEQEADHEQTLNRRRDAEREIMDLRKQQMELGYELNSIEVDRFLTNEKIKLAIDDQILKYQELRKVVVDAAQPLSDAFSDILDTGDFQSAFKSYGKQLGSSFIKPFIDETFQQKIGKFDLGFKKNLLGFIPGIGKKGGELAGQNFGENFSDIAGGGVDTVNNLLSGLDTGVQDSTAGGIAGVVSKLLGDGAGINIPGAKLDGSGMAALATAAIGHLAKINFNTAVIAKRVSGGETDGLLGNAEDLLNFFGKKKDGEGKETADSLSNVADNLVGLVGGNKGGDKGIADFADVFRKNQTSAAGQNAGQNILNSLLGGAAGGGGGAGGILSQASGLSGAAGAGGAGGAGAGAAAGAGGLILLAAIASVNGAMAAMDAVKKLDKDIDLRNIPTQRDRAMAGMEAGFAGFFDTIGMGSIGGKLGKVLGKQKGANASTALIAGVFGPIAAIMAGSLGIDFGIMQGPSRPTAIGRGVNKIAKRAGITQSKTKIGNKGRNRGFETRHSQLSPNQGVADVFESLGFEAPRVIRSRAIPPGRSNQIKDAIKFSTSMDMEKTAKGIFDAAEGIFNEVTGEFERYTDMLKDIRTPKDALKAAGNEGERALDKVDKTVYNFGNDAAHFLGFKKKNKSRQQENQLFELLVGEQSERLDTLRFREALGIGASLADNIETDAPQIANRLIANFALLNFSAEETKTQLQQFAQAAELELPSALRKLAEDFRDEEQNFTMEGYSAAVGGLLNLFDMIPDSVDGAKIALAGLGDTGEIIEQKKIERVIQVVQAGVNAIRDGLANALESNNLYDTGVQMAKTFADAFLSQLYDQLVMKTAVGAIMEKASISAALAIERLVAGDKIGAEQLLRQSAMEFRSGMDMFNQVAVMLAPVVNQYKGGLGVFGGGDIINPSGSGFMSFDTPTVKTVPGSFGSPMPAIVHGGETVRNPRHEDQIVNGLYQLSSAVNSMRVQPIINIKVLLNGKEIAKEVQVDIQKAANPINLPQPQIGA